MGPPTYLLLLVAALPILLRETRGTGSGKSNTSFFLRDSEEHCPDISEGTWILASEPEPPRVAH